LDFGGFDDGGVIAASNNWVLAKGAGSKVKRDES
jgi:hypothetical protein